MFDFDYYWVAAGIPACPGMHDNPDMKLQVIAVRMMVALPGRMNEDCY